MTYRDITCDPFGGSRLIDKTAAGMLDVLTMHTGSPVSTADVDAAILAAGGRPSWKLQAAKALRNIGWVVDATRQRHRSTWRLAGTPDELEEYRQRVIKGAYSQAITLGRTLAGQARMRPADLTASTSLRYVELVAITLGGDPAIGKTAAQVLADLDPLTV